MTHVSSPSFTVRAVRLAAVELLLNRRRDAHSLLIVLTDEHSVSPAGERRSAQQMLRSANVTSIVVNLGERARTYSLDIEEANVYTNEDSLYAHLNTLFNDKTSNMCQVQQLENVLQSRAQQTNILGNELRRRDTNNTGGYDQPPGVPTQASYTSAPAVISSSTDCSSDFDFMVIVDESGKSQPNPISLSTPTE
jgi:hypothetical protein